MTDDPWADDVVRITPEEAADEHVDDLLQRQAALRGESSRARARGRGWMYQTWFLFLVVGGVCAALAWAIIEPHFDDRAYVQGPIEAISPLADVSGLGAAIAEVPGLSDTALTIDGKSFWLLGALGHLDADEQPLDEPPPLRVGDEVGLYVETVPTPAQKVYLGEYVIHSPRSLAGPLPTIEEQEERTSRVSLVIFALIAALVGLGLGMVDGVVCRQLKRALVAGGVGVLVGFVGGFVSGLVANIVYSVSTHFAGSFSEGSVSLTPAAFAIQMAGRSVAWAVAGMAMGLGHGLALRSARLVLYGVLGGILGGLLGGLVFDPIDHIILGGDAPSSHISRLVGFVAVGATVGLMIGIVERLARDAWLRMVQGPLAGKEFLLFKDVMRVGSSPRCDLYLFNDPQVLGHHATLRRMGEECHIESEDPDRPVEVDGQPVRSARIRSGARIAIGATTFVFEQRKG